MKDRIYVCHTYYHAYISFLKEFAKREASLREGKDPGEATLILSTLSNDFEEAGERYLASGIFKEVLSYEEKREDAFPSLDKYRVSGNIIKNFYNRMMLMKKFSQELEADIPVDFSQYGDVYVFSDRDPIGFYLNKHRIHYHAVEDGLNTLKYIDLARFGEQKLWGLKRFMAQKLNLILIPNGYSKYCDDMEVNDISCLKYPQKNFIEVPRKTLTDRLTDEEKEILIKAFIRDADKLKEQIAKMGDEDKILVLTDPVCSLDVREKIFRDIIEMYEPEGKIFLKPHPRDVLDYPVLFKDYPQFDATVPMELMNIFPGLHFKKAIGVLTEMKAITFADEVVRLGADFMDKYEAPEIHRQNEFI